MTPLPDRRAVLRSGLGVGLGTVLLAGCGVRLEDDAPDLPFVPRREPVEGEAALLTVLAALSHGPDPLDRERADALDTSLEQLQVPATDRAAARSTTGLSVAEQVTAFEGAVQTAPPTLLPLAGVLLATRRATGDLPADAWSPPGTTTWSVPDAATEALAAVRAADWAMTALRAKGDEQLRQRADDAHEALVGVEQRLTAAADGAEAADLPWYRLDEPVESAEQAQTLGRDTLTRLVDALVAVLPELDRDRAAALDVATWVADALAMGQAWGAEVTALPGLTT